MPPRPSRGAPKERRSPPPLDTAALERLALRYVERFSTTRSRLSDYLRRKIRERGWEGEPADPIALAEKMADLGYIDDRAFGEARGAAMARRGLGKRRVSMAFRQDGIEEEDVAALTPAIEDRALQAALTFARKKRIGPFASVEADRVLREKQIGMMIRAGHDFTLSRSIATLLPDASIDDLA